VGGVNITTYEERLKAGGVWVDPGLVVKAGGAYETII
jgi:hypothetical protein